MRYVSALILCLMPLACADPQPGSCECTAAEVCVEGQCLPANRCPDLSCPVGHVCEDGACISELGCATDSDCDGGRCVEGGCYAVECTEGDEETISCPRCGTTTRICRDRVWLTPNPCQDQGECEAGAEEEGPCSMGARVCDDTCVWGPWEGRGEACEAGTSEDEACGACGARTRSCDEACMWGDWTECDEEAGCEAGTTETQPCGSDQGLCVAGTQTRTCGEDCVFGEWAACQGSTEPTDEICGDGLDQDCDGQDLEVPDEYEPNGSCAAAYYLGDDPNPGNPVDFYPNFHNTGDRDDYFFFTFQDSPRSDLLEDITISLQLPPGHKSQLFLYRDRAACMADRPVRSSFRSNDGGDFEFIVHYEDPNADETGNWYLRVRRVEGTTCEPSRRFIMRVQ